jgi:hypothetical protein
MLSKNPDSEYYSTNVKGLGVKVRRVFSERKAFVREGSLSKKEVSVDFATLHFA